MGIFFQVILVQVNPGETFTIRTDDGHIQCIQGKGNSNVWHQMFCSTAEKQS